MSTSQLARTIVIEEGDTARQWSQPWLRMLVGLVVAAGLLAFAFRSVDTAQVVSLLARLGPGFGAVLAAFLLTNVFDSLGWQRFLSALGQPVPFVALLRVRLGLEALQMVAPGGSLVADSVTPVLLRARCATPFPDTVASLATRKAFLALTQGTFILAAALSGGALIAAASARTGAAWLSGAFFASAAALLLVGGLAVASLRGGSSGEAVRRGLALLPWAWLRDRLSSWQASFGRFDAGLAQLFRTREAWSGAVFTGLVWITSVFETWIVLALLGAPITFAQAVPIEAAASVMRIVGVALPGALGAQEIGYLAFIAATGAPDAVALCAAFAAVKRVKEGVWTLAGYGLLARWRG